MVKELNDFAGQREVIAEDLLAQICVELSKDLQELKQERKLVKLLGDELWQQDILDGSSASKTGQTSGFDILCPWLEGCVF